MTSPRQEAHTHVGRHTHSFDSDSMIEGLEVEGQFAKSLLHEAAIVASGWLAAGPLGVQRVVDLGCGPGVGTVELADTFPSASIVGVDASAPMLARAAVRAERNGLRDRIELRQLDLEDDLTILGRADLVVAAMSIHHVADEVATLRHVRSLLKPSGVLCVLERADPISARLTEDLGRPGIWERFEEAWRLWFETQRQHLPGAQDPDRYPELFADAELELLGARSLATVVDVPHDAPSERFAMEQLRRTASELEVHATAADLAALRQHLDHGAVCADPSHRPALKMSRKLLIARAA